MSVTEIPNTKLVRADELIEGNVVVLSRTRGGPIYCTGTVAVLLKSNYVHVGFEEAESGPDWRERRWLPSALIEVITTEDGF